MTIKEALEKYSLVKAYNIGIITVLNKEQTKIVGQIYGSEYDEKDIKIRSNKEYIKSLQSDK